jgi:hypothetical protein
MLFFQDTACRYVLDPRVGSTADSRRPAFSFRNGPQAIWSNRLTSVISATRHQSKRSCPGTPYVES